MAKVVRVPWSELVGDEPITLISSGPRRARSTHEQISSSMEETLRETIASKTPSARETDVERRLKTTTPEQKRRLLDDLM